MLAINLNSKHKRAMLNRTYSGEPNEGGSVAPPDAIELAEFGNNGRNGAKDSDKDLDESRNPMN